MPDFWKGAAETVAPEQRSLEHLARLREHAALVYGSSVFYRTRFDESGVDPGQLDSFEALSSLPVLTKDQIIDDQKSKPPYGTMIGVDPGEIIRQYIGPGPQTAYFTREDLAVSIDDAAWCFSTNGFRSDDVVDVTIMYHWVIAGTIIDDGYRNIGCAVIPGGIGMSRQHIDAWRWSGVTGLFAFPTFLDELGRHVEEAGIDPEADLALRLCTISGEQRSAGAKQRMEDFWGGMKVREIYGGSEVPFVAAEADDGGGMYLNPEFIVEVVDPDTHRPVAEGDAGVLVVTDLRRRAYPILRYFTGDITEGLEYHPGASGRTTPRMGRILGRAGDIPRVKGLFVVPGQVEVAAATVADFGTLQLVIDRPGLQDTLLVRLEHAGKAEDRPALAGRLVGALKEHIRLTCEVELLDAGGLGEGAPAVVDRRRL